MLHGGVMAVHLPVNVDENAYEQLAVHYESCDLVLVEGGLDSHAPKVEMWRSARENPPSAQTRGDIAAVVTDDPVEVGVPCWPRSAVPALADHILALAGLGGRPGSS